MADAPRNPPAPVARRALFGRILERLNLRFPTLFTTLLVITVVDLFVPDIIPFVDEIVLALITAILGLWKARREPPVTVEPPPRLGP